MTKAKKPPTGLPFEGHQNLIIQFMEAFYKQQQ
jgi:hypothetical protein